MSIDSFAAARCRVAGRMAIGVGVTTLTGAALLLSGGAPAMAAGTQPATGAVAVQNADHESGWAAADLAWGTGYVKKVAGLKKQVRELPDLDPEFDKRIKELDAQIKAQSKEAEGRIGALGKRLAGLEQQVRQLKDAAAKAKGEDLLADARKKFAPLTGHRLQEDRFGAEWEAAVRSVRAVEDLVKGADGDKGTGGDKDKGKDGGKDGDKAKDGDKDKGTGGDGKDKSGGDGKDKGRGDGKGSDRGKSGGTGGSSLTGGGGSTGSGGATGTGGTGASATVSGSGSTGGHGVSGGSGGSSKLGIAAGNGGAAEQSGTSALWIGSGVALAALGGAGTTYAVRRRAKR